MRWLRPPSPLRSSRLVLPSPATRSGRTPGRRVSGAKYNITHADAEWTGLLARSGSLPSYPPFLTRYFPVSATSCGGRRAGAPLRSSSSRCRERSRRPCTSPSSSSRRSGCPSCNAATRSRGSQSVAHRAANLSPSLATHCPPFSETGRCLSRAGCLTTAGVLCVGFGAFINGNKRLAQSMMRARVAAQFATIVAMGVATKYYSDVEAAKEPTKPKAATPGPAVV